MDMKGSNYGLISSTICHLPTALDESKKYWPGLLFYRSEIKIFQIKAGIPNP
jgi:hypothetical protein